MNLLDFHSKLSSSSQERINQYNEDLLLFHLLNGATIDQKDLVNISHRGTKTLLEFTSPECAKIAEDKISAQIIPGVCGAPLYGIYTVQEQSSLVVEFIEL